MYTNDAAISGAQSSAAGASSKTSYEGEGYDEGGGDDVYEPMKEGGKVQPTEYVNTSCVFSCV